MSALLRMRVGVVAAGLSCLVMGYAWAQQEQREEAERPDAGQIDRPLTEEAQEFRAEFRAEPAVGQNQELTRYLANRLIAVNEGLIEVYELAQQQAENQEVKQFAQESMQDHRQLVQQLQQLAGPQPGAQQPGQPVQPPGARGQLDAQRQPATAQGLQQTLNQLTQIDRQVIQRANEAIREELQEKQGAEFDQAFLGTQVGSHIQLLAALEVLAQQGPDQLRQVAQQAQSDVREHLDHAKQLKQQLDQQRQPGARAERRPRQPAQTR